ncbi:MAG: IS3 family transposase [Corynebacterium sp.]|nr:IS3 family transposase [Corynebacterium sp.]
MEAYRENLSRKPRPPNEETLKRRAHRAYNRNLRHYRNPTRHDRSRVIWELRSEHGFDHLLSAAGISRSTYYYNLKNVPDTELENELIELIYDKYLASKKRWGSARIMEYLAEQGFEVGEHVVRKLMKQLGIEGKVGRTPQSEQDYI